MAQSRARGRDIRTDGRSWLNGALGLTLIAGLCLLVVLGLVFALTRQAQRVTGDAFALHHADEGLRAATVVRAQIGLATYMVAVDDALGINSADAIELSLSEANTALDDLSEAMSALGADPSPDVARAVEANQDFATTSEQALAAVTDGDPGRARSLSNEHQDRFEATRSELEGVRQRLAASVEDSDELLGQIETVTLFLVAFLVPAAIILTHRQLVLRQKRQADLESRLEMQRRLGEAREDFIANASHELRTPLTGVIGLAQILADDPAIASSESASELLHLIIAESHDLTRMVEDLLTTARLDAHALHFDFDDLAVEEVVADVVEPLVRAGVGITWDCEPAKVRADGLRTRQVLRNLISNARKYGGGRIEVVGRDEGALYRCDVIDDGEGLPEDLANRIFERYIHRGGRTGVSESVGLGLSIVNALTEGMGGSVVYERVDRKTIFTVRLPTVRGGKLEQVALGERTSAGTS